ncbi:MAG: hypothetical protein ACTSQY_06815 [Candidatus Odinarchaeia archaeon]
MSEKIRTFTASEVQDLIGYTSSIIFDTVLANFEIHGKKESRENSLKLLRKWGRLLTYPELILEEIEKEEKNEPIFPLTIKQRELIFEVLGNRSLDTISMNDKELLAETVRQLRDYK